MKERLLFNGIGMNRTRISVSNSIKFTIFGHVGLANAADAFVKDAVIRANQALYPFWCNFGIRWFPDKFPGNSRCLDVCLSHFDHWFCQSANRVQSGQHGSKVGKAWLEKLTFWDFFQWVLCLKDSASCSSLLQIYIKFKDRSQLCPLLWKNKKMNVILQKPFVPLRGNCSKPIKQCCVIF